MHTRPEQTPTFNRTSHSYTHTRPFTLLPSSLPSAYSHRRRASLLFASHFVRRRRSTVPCGGGNLSRSLRCVASKQNSFSFVWTLTSSGGISCVHVRCVLPLCRIALSALISRAHVDRLIKLASLQHSTKCESTHTKSTFPDKKPQNKLIKYAVGEKSACVCVW